MAILSFLIFVLAVLIVFGSGFVTGFWLCQEKQLTDYEMQRLERAMKERRKARAERMQAVDERKRKREVRKIAKSKRNA